MRKAPALEEKKAAMIKSRVQHVYRHRDSGRHYLRGYRQGKEIWKIHLINFVRTASADIIINLKIANSLP